MRKPTILFALLAVLSVWGCTEEEFGPVLRLGDAPAFTRPGANSSIVITEENAAETFATFEWSAADFGFPAGVTYTVEMDLAGNNFADPVALGPAVNTTQLTVLNQKVNNLLIAKGVAGGEATAVEVRIVATISNEVDPLISAPLAMSVTPFEQEIDYPKLYVPGSYQGWNPAETSTVIYSVPNNGRYEGYLYFADPGTKYKFTEGPNWDNNFGDNGADGTLEKDGADIQVAEPGLYRLSVDINKLTHSSLMTNWGLIGSATPKGWDSDTDMIYDPATGTLKLTLNLTEGAIKFRANDNWDVNLGDTGADGTLEYGGEDIVIAEAGNYTVELILNRPIYTYTLTKN